MYKDLKRDTSTSRSAPSLLCSSTDSRPPLKALVFNLIQEKKEILKDKEKLIKKYFNKRKKYRPRNEMSTGNHCEKDTPQNRPLIRYFFKIFSFMKKLKL